MWKPNLELGTLKPCLWLFKFAIALMGVACTSGGSLTLVPTQTLIPSTATHTPVVPTEIPTSRPPLLPGDLIQDVPEILAQFESETARQMAQLVIDDLQVSYDAIEQLHIDVTQWAGANFNCDPGTGPEVEGFRILIVVEGAVYEYHTDQVETIQRCSQALIRETEPDVLTIVDPIAAEMVLLARQRVTEQANTFLPRVRLEAISPVIWPDSSLGCPAEGQSYTQGEVSGYRVVVSYRGDETVFHTDFQTLLQCNPEDEVLP